MIIAIDAISKTEEFNLEIDIREQRLIDEAVKHYDTYIESWKKFPGEMDERYFFKKKYAMEVLNKTKNPYVELHIIYDGDEAWCYEIRCNRPVKEKKKQVKKVGKQSGK